MQQKQLKQRQETKIKVNITKEIYCNDDFHIYIAEQEFEEMSIKCTGFDLAMGEKTLVGYFDKPYMGQKTFVCSYEEFDSTSKEAQFNLLCTIPGIKERRAEQIMEEVKDINIFREENCPKIKGIGKGIILLIKEGLVKLDKMTVFKNLNMLLGGKTSRENIAKINKIIELKEDLSIESFKQNPYYLLINFLEMSFTKADQIALNIGIQPHDYNRNKYMVEWIVYFEVQSNCYIEYESLVKKLVDYGIQGDFTQTRLNRKYSLTDLIDKNERLVIEGTKVYTSKIYNAETEIPKLLNLLNRKGNAHEKNVMYCDSIEALTIEFEKKNKIKFDEMQKEAIKTSVIESISIVTGGAGCGKTTLLKCILYILERKGYLNILTAPTGKAARRMNQATGMESTTIHSFILREEKQNIDDVEFNFNESNDISGKKSVMVIDEFSMVDVCLFHKLLCSIMNLGNFLKLIIVGDPGQLPSVQAGNCLHDLINSEVYPVIKLTKTFRQEADSNIIPIATQIRNNEMFQFMKKKDFFVRECIDEDEYMQQTYSMYKYLYEKYDDLDKFYNEVQFIAPMKKGSNGVNAINNMLKRQFNPKKNGLSIGSIVIAQADIDLDFLQKVKKKDKYKIVDIEGDSVIIENERFVNLNITKTDLIAKFKPEEFQFDINDKIMNIKNDKENDVYNGEFGRITNISHKSFTVYFSDLEKDVTYSKSQENINKFQLSYCCTVHKLQGSEFKYICMIVENDSFICDSRLLYTGITRGKQTVILLTEKGIIEKVVRRNNLLKRNTFLKERLQQESSRSLEITI